MGKAKRWGVPIRFGLRPTHGPDVRVERVCHSKRLSSRLSSHLSQHHPKAHPNGRRFGHAPSRGLGSRPSSGSAALTLTPVAVSAWGGIAGVGLVSFVSRLASSGGSP